MIYSNLRRLLRHSYHHPQRPRIDLAAPKMTLRIKQDRFQNQWKLPVGTLTDQLPGDTLQVGVRAKSTFL